MLVINANKHRSNKLMVIAWEVSIQMRDGENKPCATNFFVAGAQTIAQVQTLVDTLLPLIDAITMNKIVGASAAAHLSLVGGLDTPADPQANRSYKGEFTFATDDGFKSKVNIPGFNTVYVLDNSPNIDVANTDIDAFLDAFFAGATTDNRGDSLTSTYKAIEVFG
jgi:hypothetical protein